MHEYIRTLQLCSLLFFFNLNLTRVYSLLGFSSRSALFRHEVAFVLGQLQNPVTVAALIKVVEDERENNMVRHEAIEALGSIGTPDCVGIIRNYVNDTDDLIRESCLVALDIQEYNNSSQFQPFDKGD